MGGLGAEKRVDVARDYGYKDGSTITHMLNNLKKQAGDEPAVAGRLTSQA